MTRKSIAVLLADVVERADVRMVRADEIARASRSNRSRNCGSAAKCVGQDLDRDGAIEPRVARAIDLAHAAGAERATIS